MKPTNREIDETIDRAAKEIRETEVDPAAIASAASRVRARLASETATPAPPSEIDHIHGCDDFQSLVPAYLGGTLSDARRLLLEDHTRECVPCRRALKVARTGEPAATPIPARRSAARPRNVKAARWAIAAGLVAALGVLTIAPQWLPGGASLEAVVEAAEGPIYQVGDLNTLAIGLGDRVDAGERIRTSREAGAVLRLADGSRVELRERSELELSGNAEAPSIRLARGNIIVKPASASSRLYVAAPSCLVTVDGATVAVNSGTKGTRVSAIDGGARIVSGGEERAIAAGEQYATSPSIEPVPVAREVAWSRDADRYATLLAELSALRRDIDAIALSTEPRYESRLLDLVPADTVFYAAIPNIATTLGEANRLMQQRIAENEALRQWWEKENGAERRGVGAVVEQLSHVGSYLGAEVVVALSKKGTEGPDTPLVLAEVRDGAGLKAYAQSTANAFGEAGKALRIVDDPASIAGDEKDVLYLWVGDSVLAASPSAARLREATTALAGAGSFHQSPFHARLAEEYRAGVEFMVAADLGRVIPEAVAENKKARNKEADAMERLGLTDVRYFVAKSSGGERADTRAVVSFAGERRGAASWLAAPGPMGALDFISPDANVVAAFVVAQPAMLVDDIFGLIGSQDPQALEHLRRFESEHGVNIRNDFAAPLGGEVAFAVDGPLLPTPSWKMVIEVNDPTRLEQSIEHAIREINVALAADGKPQIAHARTDVSGRAFYSITTPASQNQVHYAFASGYMIVAPSQALVDRAIRYRESGYSLTTSPRFTAALPADGHANFSALVYHDLAPLVAGVTEKLPAAQDSPLASMAEALPTLAFAYAREDRIEFGTTGSGGPFGLSPASMLGVPGSIGLQQLVEKAIGDK